MNRNDLREKTRNSNSIDYTHKRVISGFDLRGSVTERRVNRLLELFVSLASGQRTGVLRLLDIGCGTGRFAIPLAQRGIDVVGADASETMLREAMAKPDAHLVTWTKQNICAQNFESESFDIVFASDLLHHITDQCQALRECLRVLRPGGWLVCKYGAIENIAGDPEHVFFPGALAIDASRTPTIETMEANFLMSGFTEIRSISEAEQTRDHCRARLQAAAAKSISVLQMIDSKQLVQGLARMQAHLEANPNDPWFLFDTTTWTCGQRPRCRDNDVR